MEAFNRGLENFFFLVPTALPPPPPPDNLWYEGFVKARW
jgi:hypothetical protein